MARSIQSIPSDTLPRATDKSPAPRPLILSQACHMVFEYAINCERPFTYPPVVFQGQYLFYWHVGVSTKINSFPHFIETTLVPGISNLYKYKRRYIPHTMQLLLVPYIDSSERTATMPSGTILLLFYQDKVLPKLRTTAGVISDFKPRTNCNLIAATSDDLYEY